MLKKQTDVIFHSEKVKMYDVYVTMNMKMRATVYFIINKWKYS